MTSAHRTLGPRAKREPSAPLRSAVARQEQLDDVGVDAVGSERAGHGDAVVAVAYEVFVAYPVDLDRRQRRATVGSKPHKRPTAAAVLRRAKRVVERHRLVTVGSADDAGDRDGLDAAAPSRRGGRPSALVSEV